MSAYLVFTRDKTRDQGELDIYAREAQTTLIGHAVEVLALYGSHEDLEGVTTEGIVILEFSMYGCGESMVREPALSQGA
jgi:hypothetical protein